jgi:hypothetical protein
MSWALESKSKREEMSFRVAHNPGWPRERRCSKICFRYESFIRGQKVEVETSNLTKEWNSGERGMDVYGKGRIGLKSGNKGTFLLFLCMMEIGKRNME